MPVTNIVLTIPNPGEVVMVEKPYPKIKIGYTLIKQHIAPVCGEYVNFREGRSKWFWDEEHQGHEGVGEIVEVAEGSRFEIGDRVIIYQLHSCGGECFVCSRGLSPTTCMTIPYESMPEGTLVADDRLDVLDGAPAIEVPGGLRAIEIANGSESGGFGFSQYRIAPEDMIQKIPDELRFKYAAAANCFLGCTFTSTEEIGVKAGDWVLAAGVGFTGLGVIVNAKYRGAKVIALGRNEFRMDLARQAGADHIVNPEATDWLEQIHELTGYLQGVDACFECSGAQFYQYKCLDAARRYGKVFFMGGSRSKERLGIHVMDHLMNRHLWITAGHDVRIKDRERLLNMLLEPEIQKKIDVLVTHEYPMTEAEEAFKTAFSRECGKIYLLPLE